MWGCSSAGRALPSQGRGREFKSLHLHHHDDQRSDVVRPLFYFLFFVLPSPLPLGTITPRRIRKLHSSVARPAPEETTPPSCGRQRANETPERMSGCLRASRLRQPLLSPTPGRTRSTWPGPSDPVASSLRPCRKSTRQAFSAPCPLRRASFNRHAPTDGHFPRISPTCFRLRRACRTASKLPDTPRSEHFRFIAFPSRDKFHSPKKVSQKIFLLNLPTRTGRQTTDVFSQKACRTSDVRRFRTKPAAEKDTEHGRISPG